MGSTPRSSALLVALLGSIALAGCDIVEIHRMVARITVDPTIVREVIHQGSPHPSILPADVPLAEVACLQSTPPTCFVRERITATVFNVGQQPLEWTPWCGEGVQYLWEGEWRWALHRICAAIADGPAVAIAPGQSLDVPVYMSSHPSGRLGSEPAGRYRVIVDLSQNGQALDEALRTSEPFDFQPLPESVFRCPTEDLNARARQLAAEALVKTPQSWGQFEQMLQLERRFPGFGGTYLDGGLALEDRVFGLWLAEDQPPEPVIAAIQERWAQAPSVVKQSPVTFSELLGWLPAIDQSGLFTIGGASYEIDHVRHMIRFESANPWRVPDVDCFMRGIGIPEGLAYLAEP